MRIIVKHIDIRDHAFRQYIRDRKIEIDYIPSNYQPVNVVTKAPGNPKHYRFCQVMGLRYTFDDAELIKYLDEDYDGVE